MNEYHKCPQADFQFVVFKPRGSAFFENKLRLAHVPIRIASQASYLRLHKTTMQILGKILSENSQFCSHADAIEGLLYVLSECCLELKLSVLDVYIDLLKRNVLTKEFGTFATCLEQITYGIYKRNIKTDSAESRHLNRVLDEFFKHHIRVDRAIVVRMAKFLLNEDNFELQDGTLKILIDILLGENVAVDDVFGKCDFIEKCLKPQFCIFLRFVSHQTVVEFNRFGTISPWESLRRNLHKFLQTQKCGENCVILSTFALLDKVVEELIYVRTNIGAKALDFFGDVELVKLILTAANDHADQCKTPLDLDTFYKLLVYLPAASTKPDLALTLNYIAYPILAKSKFSWNLKCKFTQDPLLMKLAKSTYGLNKNSTSDLSAKWLNKLLYLAFSKVIATDFEYLFELFPTILGNNIPHKVEEKVDTKVSLCLCSTVNFETC